MSKTISTSATMGPTVTKKGANPFASSSTIRAAAIALVFLGLGLTVPMAIGSVLLMTLLVQATINAIFALSVGVLLRMNGVVSFGNAAFYGIAVYVVGIGVSRGGIPVELVILAALIIPALLGFALGLGVVGVPGAAFAMLTLAVGQAFYEFAIKARDLTGGEDGFDITFPKTLFGLPSTGFQKPQTMFVICWAVLILTIFVLYLISRTQFGRVAIAIRENEERARFVGYRTRARRAAVLALSAFIAAMAGVLLALYSAYVSPDVLHWSASGSALIMAIIGGAQLLWGPALGAVIFFFFKDILGDLTEHWQGLIGVTLIVVTLLIPNGVGGWLTTLRGDRKARGSR
jgi:branched-chain amino acid transport system permease protein